MATNPATTLTSNAPSGKMYAGGSPTFNESGQQPSPQPWTQRVTTPVPLPVANATPGLVGQTSMAAPGLVGQTSMAAPGLVGQTSMAAPGLLGPTNAATASTNTPTLLSQQVQTVTNPNSPIMQRAAAEANEASNDKGLLNSSMAIGAAQNAVLNAAVPIATGDVNAINTAGLATQQQQSQASLSNAQQANAMQTAQAQLISQANLQNSQQANTMQGQQAQLTSQANLQNSQQANAMQTQQAQLTSQANLQNAQAQNAQIMSQLGQANQVQLNALNNQYQSFLNSNQNASTLYNNTLAQIGNIQSNPNIDAATKTAQIQQLMTYLQSGLSMMSATSGLNLSAGLNFGTPSTTGNAQTGSGGLLTYPGGLSSMANPAPAPTPTTAPTPKPYTRPWHGHGLKPA